MFSFLLLYSSLVVSLHPFATSYSASLLFAMPHSFCLTHHSFLFSPCSSIPGPACTVGASASCYTAAAITLNVGQCKAGVHTCTAEQTWGACVGQVIPVCEVLGNCNGMVDESELLQSLVLLVFFGLIGAFFWTGSLIRVLSHAETAHTSYRMTQSGLGSQPPVHFFRLHFLYLVSFPHACSLFLLQEALVLVFSF